MGTAATFDQHSGTVQFNGVYLDHLSGAELDNTIRERLAGNTALTHLQFMHTTHGRMAENKVESALQLAARTTVTLAELHLSHVPLSVDIARGLRTLLTACTSLRALRLDFCALRASECWSLADMLMHDTCLISLNLSNNEINAEGCTAIARALLTNSRLQSLSLASNKIGIAGANSLGRSLVINTTLRQLDLSGSSNQISFGLVADLLHGLQQNRSLQTVKLGGTNMLQPDHQSGPDIRALVDALENHAALQRLELASEVDCRDSAEAIGRLLERNTSLDTVVLADALIDGGDAVCIGRALACNTTLRRFHVGFSSLEAADITAFAEGLRQNSTLQALSLGCLNTERHCWPSLAALTQALTCNTALEHVHLVYQQGPHNTKIVSELLQANLEVRSIDISGSHVGDMEAVCSALQLCASTRLICLKLGSEGWGNVGRATADLLKHNTTLQHLDLSSLQKILEPPACDAVLSALRHNSTLQSLVLPLYIGKAAHHTLMMIAATLRGNMTLNRLGVGVEECTRPCSTCQDCIMQKEACEAIGKALRDCPRYHPLNLEGVPLSKAADSLQLLLPPGQTAWTVPAVLEQLRGEHLHKLIAFTMAQHARLGSTSCARHLSNDDMRMVVLLSFGLPADYLDKDRRMFQYVKALLHTEFIPERAALTPRSLSL